MKVNILEFQDFALDLEEKVLLRGGRPTSLPPKALELLLVLVERPGHIFTKEELLGRVWPDTFVEEGNLTYTVRLLRKALGDFAEAPQFIETVPRRGYRFVAEITQREATGDETATAFPPAMLPNIEPERRVSLEADDQGPQTESQPSPPVAVPEPGLRRSKRTFWIGAILSAAILVAGAVLAAAYIFSKGESGAGEKRSIVVLPFVNESANSEMEFLSDGVTESLINSLSEFKGLRVVARGTAFRYKKTELEAKEIGATLGVDAVLTGKVTQFGDTVIVQSELISVDDGSQLWGERQTQKLSNLPTIPESIARAIVNRLHPELEGEIDREFAGRFSRSSEAYQLDMKGRFFWNRRTEEGLQKGVGYFEQAIAEDPGYALAYVGLADSFNVMGFYCFLPPDQAFPKARVAARKALELKPDLAEAYNSLAYANLYYEWDTGSAERNFLRAIQLKPNYSIAHQWYGNLLTATGRWNEALASFERAQEIDPLSPVITAVPAWTYYYSRHYDKAIDPCRKAIELDPNFALAHTWLGQAYERKGDYEKAIAEFKESLRISKGSLEVRALLAHAYAVSGRSDQARTILGELLRTEGKYVSPYMIATVYAGLGEPDPAFRWLEKSVADRQHVLVFLDYDPRLDGLRRDPRFELIRSRIRPAG